MAHSYTKHLKVTWCYSFNSRVSFSCVAEHHRPCIGSATETWPNHSRAKKLSWLSLISFDRACICHHLIFTHALCRLSSFDLSSAHHGSGQITSPPRITLSSFFITLHHTNMHTLPRPHVLLSRMCLSRLGFGDPLLPSKFSP